MNTNTSWARFWAVDLHVHTPASNDAKYEDFGNASDIVGAAINCGLDAIAVTDHNTAAWCGEVARAAQGTNLVVLPGFELSTQHGHLLGIWEEGTDPSAIEDVLIRLGLERSQLGSTNIVAAIGMAECAERIGLAGGIAIAAHIDKDKGILKQPVQIHVNQLLADPRISAFEYVLDETPSKVAQKLGSTRRPEFIRSSDAYDATLSRHALSGIGVRRTWIKAARPDLCGIRYALDDPDLRLRLSAPPAKSSHPAISRISISGGFLQGVDIEFSPDLNSLLGGTGAGKSLTLEAIRYALGQQVDSKVFRAIRDEVDRRLESALGEGSTVAVEVSTGSDTYRISRTFRIFGSRSVVQQLVDGDWIQLDQDPAGLIAISAFSQGEILEYARQPVGRVGLVDAQLQLSDMETRISGLTEELKQNGRDLVQARDRVQSLRHKAAQVDTLKDRERELSTLFDGDLVQAQGRWAAEQAAVAALAEQVDAIDFARPPMPELANAKMPEHDEKFQRIRDAQTECRRIIDKAEAEIEDGISALRDVVTDARTSLDEEFSQFKVELDNALAQSGTNTLTVLRRELESVQARLGLAETAADELRTVATPRLDETDAKREVLLAQLKSAREERRALRRERINDLNAKTRTLVKLDIPSKGDTTAFRDAISALKVGSHVREPALDAIAKHIHPYSFARALWSGNVAKLGALPEGVQSTDISRLVANIADRDLWHQLLDCQIIDTPDVLNVKFRKPEGTEYARIEDLSHGQKCTAILVILLADGESPVLIDQPEDALHAPWIEEYLVDRLRDLRGSRQYIFATRSPGLVVSADSEQLITMRATAGRGEVEARGSLERYDMNMLALHHLEGGKTPFTRRTRKLHRSL